MMNQKYSFLGVDDLGQAHYTLNPEWDGGLEDYLSAFYADNDPRYIVREVRTYTVIDTSNNYVVEYCGFEKRKANRSAREMNAEIE